MKIAVCMYGQPRDYKRAYMFLTNFMKKNSNHSFDFFIHCWCDNNITLDVSPWRHIDSELRYIDNGDEIKKNIIEYYKPIGYIFEPPIKTFNLKDIDTSLAYTNSKPYIKDNINNFMSQIYSRNKVRDIFYEYTNNMGIIYDIVITLRNDYNNEININLDNIDTTKTHVSSIFCPRDVFPDNLIMCPQDVYLKWFNLYKNIFNIINNKDIEKLVVNMNETFQLNPEEYLFSNYLYYYHNLNNVIYLTEIGRWY